jgi:hypothetical protein
LRKGLDDNKNFNKEKIMSNWTKIKKMAAAFGRAVEDPSATKGGRDMVFGSKTVQNRRGDVAIDADDTPAQRSFKGGMYQGREASELTHDTKEWEDAKRIWDSYDAEEAREYGPEHAYQNAIARSGVSKYSVPGSPGEFEERFGFSIDDEFKMPEEHAAGHQANWEREAEAYTDRDLEKEFSDAFKSNINRRKEKVRGGFCDESADMFEEQLWNVIDELRANGKSGNEILDMLRVDKPRGPYGE